MATVCRFPIPGSLPDLERAPYNLLPYPEDFDDVDEVARGASFSELVRIIEVGNRTLNSANMTLFVSEEEDEEPWLEQSRIQSLYTLVRYVLRYTSHDVLILTVRCSKSTSLAPATRSALATALSKSVVFLCSIVEKLPNTETAPEEFRDAYNCHLYMLYSFMFFLESDAKAATKVSEELIRMRKETVDAMLAATEIMATRRASLWVRGVPDEAVLMLPCRIAYPMLEAATGVVARRQSCGDEAIRMLAVTVESSESQLSTVAAAVMDMMHNFEHMAAIAVDLCLVSEGDDSLATEIIREICRYDGDALGIKNVAPFLYILAEKKPKLVQQHLPQILPLLNVEPYSLRSAIVTAISHCALNATTTTTQSGLLDILAERVYDISSYTRCASLKAWLRLAGNQVIPKDRIIAVTNLAMDRLQDKTVLVRKQAMQLLTLILENNPFSGCLDPEPYREKLSELYGQVTEVMPADLKEIANEDNQAALAACIERVKDDFDGHENPDFVAKVNALNFTQSALEFMNLFEGATKALDGMLMSNNTSDVSEALRFFVKARHFQLPCAVTGMKRALTLMWSSEVNVRNEVLKAFVDVFVFAPGSNEPQPVQAIARNLITLTDEATTSELASIEEAIIRLVKEEKIPDDVFLVLWSFAEKMNATALHLIAMGSGADRAIVDSKSRLKLLLDFAFKEPNNWKMLEAACFCLQRVARSSIDPSDAKFVVLERIIDELSDICRGKSCSDTTTDTLKWFPLAEQAIKAIFVVAPDPEVTCKNILIGLSNSSLNEDKVHPLRLSRLFHVLGLVALNLLVYTEALSSSVRKANAKRSLKKQEEIGEVTSSQEAIESELGVVAEAEAENESRLADIAENEIVGRNLLSIFSPLLVRVVGNESGRFKSNSLMQIATLALCRLMCVSSSFCEKHLPLLFTALSNAPEDMTLRANTVVALGDLAFRFPNEVEPYTPRLYACLRDPSTTVRRYTLMVLTHLILNDMVKVKGQVAEIALCIRDHDLRISDMSRLLFSELSKRSQNPIYNLLPEIVSELSDRGLALEDFRAIMSFLLGFIKKERQNEMLTDKLCQRFTKCKTDAQAADLAFCISVLKLNEKAFKFLLDNFKLYKNYLHCEDLQKSFVNIVTKAKRTLKQESRQLVDDWEVKLQNTAADCEENQFTAKEAARAKRRAQRRAARKRNLAETAEVNELEDFTEDLEFHDDGKENIGVA